ncbi:indole-3-glycerol-phosphate synthase TrpC, partial [Listeria monocytogenes]|nr:indole-3-glycerol-phosphate synthase TrpC [Listeria monocytogenes]
ASDFSSDACCIREAGFRTAEDVARVSQKYNAVLVGDALMREATPEAAAKSLMVTR